MAFGRVKRTRSGFQLRFPPAERELLRTLPSQLRELLRDGETDADPAVRQRLFPAAYLDDPEAAAEFARVTRDELVAMRMAAIDTMERTVDAHRITEEELSAWLSAINDLRLVLGVRLAVTEESTVVDYVGDEETERSYEIYRFLSYIEEDVVEALSGA